MDNPDNQDKLEQTTYETEPVQNLNDAMHAFAGAYDRLHIVLQEEYKYFDDSIRTAMFTPVRPELDMHSPPISLYEIGLTHSPNRSVAGKYAIHESKLADALEHRRSDIHALLTQEESGVLPKLCAILLDFRDKERDEKLPEEIYAALMRFLNECRRLNAMWM